MSTALVAAKSLGSVLTEVFGDYRVVVGDALAGQTHDLRVVSYARDFRYLWNFGSRAAALAPIFEWLLTGTTNPPNRPLPDRTLIVVADGFPSSSGTLDLTDMVGPVEWAVVLSSELFTRCLDLEPKHRLPNIRIFIVRPEPLGAKRSADLSSEFSLGHVAPWVQLYRLAKREYLASFLAASDSDVALIRPALPPDAFDLGDLMKDLIRPERVAALARAETDSVELQGGVSFRTRLVGALAIWANRLGSPERRHSVANAIGPRVLAEGFNSQQVQQMVVTKSPQEDALAGALRSVGLIADTVNDGHKATGLLVSGELSRQIVNLGAPHVHLIDDQFMLGYHRIVATLLFGPKGAEPLSGTVTEAGVPQKGLLTCYADAKVALEWLEQVPGDAESGPTSVGNGDEILILDLRVWSSPSGRKDFFTKVLNVAANRSLFLKARDGDPLLKRSWIAAERARDASDGSDHEALALLPLLLSYADPSLPIVLFSSTQQRVLLELVGNRPGILTEFSKPLLAGSGPTRPSQLLLRDLESALRHALRLLDARPLWRRIAKIREVDPRWGTSQEVKRALARAYESYILGERFYDFLSVPLEFVEATRIGPDVVSWTCGDALGPGAGHLVNICQALKEFRNLKAHARVQDEPVATVSQNEYRPVALLLLALLIDLVSPDPAESRDSAAGKLKRAFDDQLNRQYANIVPLIRDLPWREFAPWVLLEALFQASDCMSVLSQVAIRRYGERSIKRY